MIATWAPFDTSSVEIVGQDAAEVETHIRFARRGHELRPRDETAALTLGRSWLSLDRTKDARDLAAELSTRGDGPRLVASYLRMAADASDGSPASALEEATRAFRDLDVATGSETEDRLAARVHSIAAILGREREIADLWVDRFAAEPGRIRPVGLSGALGGFLRLCTAATSTKGRRCVELVDQAFQKSGRSRSMDALFAGARLWVDGQTRRAIAAWRPVVQDAIWNTYLPTAQFEAAGEDALAEAIDRSFRTWHGDHVVRGHFMGDLRDARRAFKRGDKAKARAIAKELLEAWSALDAEVPWLPELRELAGE